jgi:hypothetical protein
MSAGGDVTRGRGASSTQLLGNRTRQGEDQNGPPQFLNGPGRKPQQSLKGQQEGPIREAPRTFYPIGTVATAGTILTAWCLLLLVIFDSPFYATALGLFSGVVVLTQLPPGTLSKSTETAGGEKPPARTAEGNPAQACDSCCDARLVRPPFTECKCDRGELIDYITQVGHHAFQAGRCYQATRFQSLAAASPRLRELYVRFLLKTGRWR